MRKKIWKERIMEKNMDLIEVLDSDGDSETDFRPNSDPITGRRRGVDLERRRGAASGGATGTSGGGEALGV